MKDYVVFTDGAYSSSRKQGGSAFIILKDGKRILEWSHTWKGGTNNTAEILAIYCALRSFKAPVDSITIYSDSQYCLGCIFEGWKRRKNIKLWKRKEFKDFEKSGLSHYYVLNNGTVDEAVEKLSKIISKVEKR